MIRRALRICREEGGVTLFKRTVGFLWRNGRGFVSANVDPPAVVLYWWFEIRSIVSSDITDANPIDPIWVNPEQIQYYHSGGPKRFGEVASGDWDKPSKRFEDNIVGQSIIARFTEGVSWNETPLYREYYSRMKKNGDSYYSRKFSNRDELEAYFESIDRLYDSISSAGYVMQRELLDTDKNGGTPDADNNHPYLHEVTVNIYRNGELAKRKSGNHRLAIAKAHPAIDEIPVLVRVRHQQWQDIRNEIRQTDASAQLSSKTRKHLDHPDLADIVPDSWTG